MTTCPITSAISIGKWLKIAPVVFLFGCASTRFYPVCNYGGEGQNSKATRNDVQLFVRGVAGPDTSVQFSPNDRYIAVSTGVVGHAQLEKIWPTAGCLGDSRYDVEYLRYKGCVNMIRIALANEGIAPLGDQSDSLDQSNFYCGRALSPSE